MRSPPSLRRTTAATSTRRSQTSQRWRADDYRVVVVHPGHGPAERMVEALGERDVPARLVEQLEATGPAGVVEVTCGALTNGLVDDTHRVAVLTGEDISGQRASTRDMRKMPARAASGRSTRWS